MVKIKDCVNDIFKAVCFLVFGILLIVHRQNISEGIRNGLSVSAEVLIPSLFPFLVFSVLASQVGFSHHIENVFRFVTEKIFHLPRKCFSVLLFGFIGGYPVGARLCRELYQKNLLTEADCRHILSFCVNAGPSFVVTAVGEGIIGSRKAGFVLLAAVSLASVITGIMTGVFKEKEIYGKSGNTEKKDFSEALIYSVSSATEAIFSICAWVILFSAFLSVVDKINLCRELRLLVFSLTEVTTGIKSAAELGGLPFVAACISFGGISILFQLLPTIKKCGVKVKTYLFFRIVNSVISYFLTEIILCFVIISDEVFSYSARLFSNNAPASAALLIMCALFVRQIGNQPFLHSARKMKFSRYC